MLLFTTLTDGFTNIVSIWMGEILVDTQSSNIASKLPGVWIGLYVAVELVGKICEVTPGRKAEDYYHPEFITPNSQELYYYHIVPHTPNYTYYVLSLDKGGNANGIW